MHDKAGKSTNRQTDMQIAITAFNHDNDNDNDGDSKLVFQLMMS